MTSTNNKNNIYIATNVLIGAFAPDKRFEAEKKCWQYVCSLTGKRVFVSSLSVAQLVSTFQKRKLKKDDIVVNVKRILSKVTVVDFTEKDITDSLSIDGRDLEDNMQCAVSRKVKCGILITQNKKDYINYLNVDILTAKECRSINQ